MFAPVFVNAGNPQLLLLAEFIAAMANANEEATNRVFGDGIEFHRRNGHWYVFDGRTNSLWAMVGPVADTCAEKSDVERMDMVTAIFDKIKELPRG